MENIIHNMQVKPHATSYVEVKNRFIKRVLAEPGMKSIRDFVEISGFPIDAFMVDNFFHNLNDGLPVYVNKELIEWCELSNGEFNRQKEMFVKYLDMFEEGKNYRYFTKAKYTEFYQRKVEQYPHVRGDEKTNCLYPDPAEMPKEENSVKHLVLSVNCFKMIMMSLNSPKSMEVKEYYIALETLIMLYAQYQMLYEKKLSLMKDDKIDKLTDTVEKQSLMFQELLDNSKLAQDKLDDMRKKNEELLNAVEDSATHIAKLEDNVQSSKEETQEVKKIVKAILNQRAVAPQKKAKHQLLRLYRLLGETPDEDLYVLRVQRKKVKSREKEILEDFGPFKLLVEYVCVPNAMYLWENIRDALKHDCHFFRNCVGLRGMELPEFLENVARIEKLKNNVNGKDMSS
jgi:hypothetical protein